MVFYVLLYCLLLLLYNITIAREKTRIELQINVITIIIICPYIINNFIMVLYFCIYYFIINL